MTIRGLQMRVCSFLASRHYVHRLRTSRNNFVNRHLRKWPGFCYFLAEMCVLRHASEILTRHCLVRSALCLEYS